MALGTFISGAYTGTFNSAALGITEDGYALQSEPKSEVINKSDVYGDATIDAIHRGVDWFVQTEFMEYKAGPLSVWAFWQSAIGVQGTIGVLASSLAFPLVLTATAGTPAAATPATLTGLLAMLAPGSNPMAQFVSRLRTIPVRMQLLPSVVSTVLRNFSTT